MLLERYNWSDLKNDDRSNIHNLFRYPGTMLPSMQEDIFNYLSESDEFETFLDPFMGSGTTIITARTKGIQSFGIDINPLSYLGVTVKTHTYNFIELNKTLCEFEIRFNNIKQFELHTFKYIEKWYKSDIIIELSKVKHVIESFLDDAIRKFLYLVFSDLVIQSNNSRKTTFKLHTKPLDEISNFEIDIYQEYLQKLSCAIENYINYSNEESLEGQSKLYLGDAIELLDDEKVIQKDSIDLIITSPPYGDNHTTVTYGQYSYCSINWIGIENIESSYKNYDYIMNTVTGIDSISLGGKRIKNYIDELQKLSCKSPSLEEILIKIDNDLPNSKQKANKVLSFFKDFHSIMDNCYAVLKKGGIAVFIVGNRTVNNTTVEFNKILLEMANSIGYEILEDLKREIKFSAIAQSIKQEHIIILRKTI